MRSASLSPTKESMFLMKARRNSILLAEESPIVSPSPAFSRAPIFLPMGNPIFPREGTPTVFPAGGDPVSVRAPVSPFMWILSFIRGIKIEGKIDQVLSSEGAPAFSAKESNFFIETRSAPIFSTKGSNFFSEIGTAYFPAEGATFFLARGDPASARVHVPPFMRNTYSFINRKVERKTAQSLSSEGAPTFLVEESKFVTRAKKCLTFFDRGI